MQMLFKGAYTSCVMEETVVFTFIRVSGHYFNISLRNNSVRIRLHRIHMQGHSQSGKSRHSSEMLVGNSPADST